MKMEEIASSETSGCPRTTRRYDPEGRTLQWSVPQRICREIEEFGYYDPISDKYLPPLPLLSRYVCIYTLKCQKPWDSSMLLLLLSPSSLDGLGMPRPVSVVRCSLVSQDEHRSVWSWHAYFQHMSKIVRCSSKVCRWNKLCKTRFFFNKATSVDKETGWRVRVRFPAWQGLFLFSTTSRSALGPTQPPIQ
jgi:hypothetical protein